MFTLKSQLIIVLLLSISLVSQVFADNTMVCDMAEQQDIVMDMSDHAHHEGMSMDVPHTMLDMEDCCDTECNCQHGVCSTSMFVNTQTWSSLAISADDIIEFNNTNAAVIYIPALLRPPIV